MKKKVSLVMIICSILLALAVIYSLGKGTYEIGFVDMINVLLGNGTKMQNTAVFTLRLPRIAIALAVGMAFSTAGCILQSATKNDLADPGMIGINAGASLAVVMLISAGGTMYYEKIGDFTMFLMPFVAIIGALLAMGTIYLLSMKKGVSPTRLILVGIGVNAGLTAFITLYQMNMAQGDYNRALVWISGSLWGSNWKYFYIVAPITLVLVFVAMYKSKVLDVLDLGDELATGLGIAVEKERKQLLFVATLLAAAATAVAGNISFLGLLGPHIAKRLVGPIHRRQIPVAALISMFIIIVADVISRNLFSPIEIPAGIVISIIGVPYFIYLMLKTKE
ncbi:ABC-type Fe3+-siderophore transport system, permease 2 component [Lachnospiraceae bacterium KM106-2]|nr:ABC-type Fe3+-siderophore transport system, permease 2 component [Lachnospiraceae bacterium KM106-2]